METFDPFASWQWDRLCRGFLGMTAVGVNKPPQF